MERHTDMREAPPGLLDKPVAVEHKLCKFPIEGSCWPIGMGPFERLPYSPSQHVAKFNH
jgi:hypothetical protein